jgi:hypothetical protein
MESIYYVMTWLCHRTCVHCYEDRFRPYYGEELKAVVAESVANCAQIIDNFPARMTYLDRNDPNGPEKQGTIILAGGEILLDAVRESVLYPSIERIHNRYRNNGGVKVVVQTTGDLLNPKIASELKALGVWMVSVSGIDSFHAGLETPEAQQAMEQKCRKILEGAGFQARDETDETEGSFFHFFGATPDKWIGKLWPRGRAWRNGLSSATLSDNFCNQWSGGLNFLEYKYSGSEVSIDPQGNFFPCCVKTKTPVGNLLQQNLESILDSRRGHPTYEAISMGHPERMGITQGWTVEKFLEKSTIRREDGTLYQNLCIGCDAFHDEVLNQGPLIQLS